MLLDQLIERQKSLGMIDSDFAELLGVSRPMWQKTRTGVQRIGTSMLRATAARFPELQGAILIYLQSGAVSAMDAERAS